MAELDCKTVSVAQIEHISADFSMPLGPGAVRVAGLGGWFDVHFRVSGFFRGDQVGKNGSIGAETSGKEGGSLGGVVEIGLKWTERIKEVCVWAERIQRK